MVLKKPSEYFKKDQVSIDNSIQNLITISDADTFSDSFESFKNNLSKIEVLSDFYETFNSYNENIEKVNIISEQIENIEEEIKSFLKREDLDRVVMSQLFVVEQNIRDVQDKVKSINEKNLRDIRSDVSSLTDNVSEFLDTEVPKYKKLIVDSELRSSNRHNELEESVNKTLELIREFVDVKYEELTEKLNGINEEKLSEIVEDFKILENKILKFQKEDAPKYKKFIVETEERVENKIKQINTDIDEKIEIIDEKIETVEEKYFELERNTIEKNKFIELESQVENINKKQIPKYKKFVVETEKKVENKIEENRQIIEDKFAEFQTNLDESIFNILEKVSLIEGDKTDLVEVVNSKIQVIKNLGERVSKQVVTNEDYRKHLTKKVAELEIEIIRNESHIKVQNKNLEEIKQNIQEAIQKLNFNEIEEKNYELSKKIEYLEELFEKFNEKTFFSEENLGKDLLTEPPSTKNSDPLTPLDKKYVTLDQLQEHYRLFINRIQQQLATIGGGGETRLKYLDDIVGIATNPSAYNNKYLKYDHNIQKFVFSEVNASSVTLNLVQLNDVDDSNLSGISTDYLMVYDPNTSGFKFVDPKTYFGINNDFNPSVDIDDFGSY